MTTKQHYYGALLMASMEGRPVIQMNTISCFDEKNLTALSLEKIQQAGANMLVGQVQFDNLAIQNVFYLGEMTREEFIKDSHLAQEHEAQSEPEQASHLSVVSNSDDSDVESLQTEEVSEHPVEDVSKDEPA